MSEAATPYPLSWPAGRPRRAADERRWPVFRTSREGGSKPITVAVSLERLNRELGRLGAQYPVVSTNLETRRDGLPRSGQPEPADPGVAVYFQLGGKPHCLPCDTYSTVAANIAAVAAHIEATRAIERYGVASVAEMFAGFMALPSPDEKRPWRDVLELRRFGSSATMEMAEENFRRLARERHPDAGGSDAMMAELNRARDDARRELGNGA